MEGIGAEWVAEDAGTAARLNLLGAHWTMGCKMALSNYNDTHHSRITIGVTRILKNTFINGPFRRSIVSMGWIGGRGTLPSLLAYHVAIE